MGSKGKTDAAANAQLDKQSTSSQVPPNGAAKAPKSKAVGYGSEGVQDNDIFNLPSSTWQLLGLLTLVAAFVRLFRIYQPSSVVFDEVQ
jgi:dolichyl-phosphate-mannose-protein mannosyltransferase